MLSSFMSFLRAHMHQSPERIRPLEAALMERVGALVSDVESSPQKDLGDEALISGWRLLQYPPFVDFLALLHRISIAGIPRADNGGTV